MFASSDDSIGPANDEEKESDPANDEIQSELAQPPLPPANDRVQTELDQLPLVTPPANDEIQTELDQLPPANDVEDSDSESSEYYDDGDNPPVGRSMQCVLSVGENAGFETYI